MASGFEPCFRKPGAIIQVFLRQFWRLPSTVSPKAERHGSLFKLLLMQLVPALFTANSYITTSLQVDGHTETWDFHHAGREGLNPKPGTVPFQGAPKIHGK